MGTLHRLKVKDFMKTQVFLIPQSASVQDTAQAMITDQVIGLGVVNEEGKLLGMVSVDDLLENKATPVHFITEPSIHNPYALMDEFKKEKKIRGMTAGEMMNPDYPNLAPEDTVDRAMNIFLQDKVPFIPVVEADKFVGVVTRMDLLKHIYRLQS